MTALLLPAIFVNTVIPHLNSGIVYPANTLQGGFNHLQSYRISMMQEFAVFLQDGNFNEMIIGELNMSNVLEKLRQKILEIKNPIKRAIISIVLDFFSPELENIEKEINDEREKVNEISQKNSDVLSNVQCITSDLYQSVSKIENDLNEKYRNITDKENDFILKVNAIESSNNDFAGMITTINENIRAVSLNLEELSQAFIPMEDAKKDFERRIFTVEENVRLNNGRIEGLNEVWNSINKLSDRITLINPSEELNLWNKISNSQAGEDSILAYVFFMLDIPFNQCSYIDLGANHPREISNTYFFYSQGARGILVDANAMLCNELRRERPGDIVINKCVDSVSGKKESFIVLNFDGLSRAGTPNDIDDLSKINPEVKISETVELVTISYNDIVSNYLDGFPPTLLNIDIEGKELEILTSIDFEKYRPLLIVVEMIPYSTSLVVGIKNEEIVNFMKSKDYEEYAFTGINSIFIDKRRNQ